MALPNKIQVNAITGSSSPALIDNDINGLKQALVDIFGIPDNTNVSTAVMTVNASGLDNLIFRNTSADPDTAGELQRNGSALKFHNGSAVRTFPTLEGANTFSQLNTFTHPNFAFTTGTTTTIKTTDDTSLILGTNDLQRLVITNNGVVTFSVLTSTTNASAGDTVHANNKMHRWLHASGTDTVNFGIVGNTGDNLVYLVPSVSSTHTFTWGSQSQNISLRYDNAATQPYIAFSHSTSSDVSAPAAGGAHIYTRIVGGKPQLVARFDSGAVQVIAAEP